jgi:hypothetical protein
VTGAPTPETIGRDLVVALESFTGSPRKRFDETVTRLVFTLNEAVAARGRCAFVCVNGLAYVDGVRVETVPVQRVALLSVHLKSRDIGGITVTEEVQPQEVADFLELLAPGAKPLRWRLPAWLRAR